MPFVLQLVSHDLEAGDRAPIYIAAQAAQVMFTRDVQEAWVYRNRLNATIAAKRFDRSVDLLPLAHGIGAELVFVHRSALKGVTLIEEGEQ